MIANPTRHARLTARQSAILQFMRRHLLERQRLPTLREIAADSGARAPRGGSTLGQTVSRELSTAWRAASGGRGDGDPAKRGPATRRQAVVSQRSDSQVRFMIFPNCHSQIELTHCRD
jgi:SOS-response transcriptional repressor LexA